MCVAAIAFHASPDWTLVAIGNRDEFHERPAAPLGEWHDEAGTIAGRDLQSGGTWLGVSSIGRFVLVTNLRGFGLPDPSRTSRGELVSRLLAGDDAPLEQPEGLLGAYNPFNLVCASQDAAHFLTNRPGKISTHLPHGIYGLSNGALDEPWAKTMQLKGALSDWLQSGTTDVSPLFDCLASERIADLGIHPVTPSDIAVEPSETPPFIRHQLYGTRCSTVVTIDRRGNGRITERRFDTAGSTTGETSLEFAWPA